MIKRVRHFVVVMMLVSSFALADLVPSSMFGDHMVLQRGMPVPVWGMAEAHEEVTVRFGDHGVTAAANKSGKWRVDLPALTASAVGRDMTILGDHEKIVFKDVVVGEVWICSGQSNMQYGWGTTSEHPMYNWGGDADLAKLVDDASAKPIRSFHLPVDVSFSPKANSKGVWSTNVSASAVAFGFSYYLHEALNVPVGVVVTCWGSSFIEGWMPLDLVEELPHFKEQVEQLWTLSSVERVNKAIEMGVRPGFVWLRKRPNLLYNAMLHPIIPYASRGMVWYQGEANASDPGQYAVSLPTWVQRLREGWGRDDFYILGVMLPGFGEDDGRPDANSWAWFREAQMKGLDMPHAAVVNTVDLGDAKDIHPSDKEPICLRLALAAREKVYGEQVDGFGPIYTEAKVNGASMVVQFQNGEGIKTLDGEAPKGFWLADKKQEWYQATAEIQGSSVVLQAENVASPTACRYAWSGKPEVNLVNEAGLPAYPFRTDDWDK